MYHLKGLALIAALGVAGMFVVNALLTTLSF